MTKQSGSAAASAKQKSKSENEGKDSSDSSAEHQGAAGDPSYAVMVEDTKKSNSGSKSHFLNRMLKPKKLGKKHSTKSNPKHSGAAADSGSIMMVDPKSKSLSGSAKHFLNITSKKLGKKHSSKSNPELLDFSQNLNMGYLAEASQQLLERENFLFRLHSSSEEVICTDDEKYCLKQDYETLMDHLKLAVHDSFDLENQEKLRSAIMAIVQQEERDKLWEEAAEECPCWRPMRCREIHDTIIKEVVEERLQLDNEEESDTDVLKRDVTQTGSDILKDLLQVVNHVQKCYLDFSVCNMYAQLYHEAFSGKLRKLLQCSVTMEDYRFILQQINGFSKYILLHEELKQHIEIEALGAFLPEEDHKLLEEQYLSHKEKEVETWLSNALQLKKADWEANKKPELLDEYYFCNLSLDVIGLFNGAMKEVSDVLGHDKAQRILMQMGSFLMSYKNCMEEFLQSQQMNITEIMKAQLFNISKIREYIEQEENLPDEVKIDWLSAVSEMRDSCHNYFLSPIHKALKENYCKLWTSIWFSKHEEIVDKFEDTLNEKIHTLKGLHYACRKRSDLNLIEILWDELMRSLRSRPSSPEICEELLSQLHFEVMIEYVKRMLKRKLKLKTKDKQEAAARFLCEDSESINTLFERNGSENIWLSDILPRVSEVIKEQDPENLELEICVLLKHHPDLSERQVCQLLQLKSRCPDMHMIRACYHQTVNNLPVPSDENKDSSLTPTFFSHLPRNISLSFPSCFCILPIFCLNLMLPCRKC